MMFDKDGSFNGGKKGFLVTNNTNIQPPALKDCAPITGGNAFACAGACYRAVYVTYLEQGFSSSSQPKNETWGNGKYR
jgi:hypothetical protein